MGYAVLFPSWFFFPPLSELFAEDDSRLYLQALYLQLGCKAFSLPL